ERDLEIAESDYREHLVLALQRTAAGHWGLLGTNQHTEAMDRSAAIQLLEAGDLIQGIRAKLGITDPFDLHARFVGLRRSCREPTADGEPKLAAQFLAELNSTLAPSK